MSTVISGQDMVSTDESINNDKWEFSTSLYLQLAGLSGDMTLMGQQMLVDVEFSDLFEKLKFGMTLHSEAHKNRWGVLFDLSYLKLEAEGENPAVPAPVNIEIEQTVIELAGMYNILPTKSQKLEAILGLRFFDMGVDLSALEMPLAAIDFDFVDPIVGLRYTKDWGKWDFMTRADVGGFGIGSDLSWKATTFIGYDFSNMISLHLGYQGYNVDYENDELTYDIYTGGFVFTIDFRF